MYRVKPQTLAAVQRTRNPTLLVALTIAVVAASSLDPKTAHCQQDSGIQAQAEHLKEHVQEFTDQVLEMADAPSSPSSSSSPSFGGREHGHSSPFFSSMGHRTGGPQSQYGGRMEKFRGAYVEEPLIPALFYVAVAGMAGSIIARKSNFVFRFFSPVALALGASAYCIPKTTNNVLHGLRTYDYKEMTREWQHKYFHAKKSIVDTTQELTAVAGSVAGTVTHSAKDAAHEISDKTHELTDKTQKALHDVKTKTVEVAHDLKGKGEDVAKEVKNKSKEMGSQLETAKDQVKDQVEDKADQAQRWWDTEKKTVEKSAKDLRRSARETGEQARDWAQNKGEESRDWFQDKRNHGFDKEDVERGFDRFKSKARHGWENARDEAQDTWSRNGPNGRDMSQEFEHRGREMRRNAEQMKNKGQDWAHDRSRDMRGRFEEVKDRSEDWAKDRRRDFKNMGREAEGQFDQARHDFKKRGEEAREFSEDRLRGAKRDLRNKAEDVQDQGRRQLGKFQQEMGEARSRSGSDDRFGGAAAAGGAAAGWGFSGRNGEDNGGRRGRFEEREEYAGRGSQRYDSEMPRRSVTEAAKEGKHWWQQKSAADPYESYDNRRQSSSSNGPSWWTAGSNSKDQAMDQFDHAKRDAERGMGRFKDSVEEKAQSGRFWLEDKSNEVKNRFEHGKKHFEHELHDKFAHGPQGYRSEQGRDFGGHHHHNHASIYSNDNWFHYGHGEDNRASAGRSRERGM